MSWRSNPDRRGTGEGACRRVMTRRAVTLLELLIVIALLLAIGALVAPAMIQQLREQSFTSAQDDLEQQLVLARSEAQRRGEMIEVIYDSDPPRVVVRAFDPDRQDTSGFMRSSATGFGNAGDDENSGPDIDDNGADLDRTALDTNWSLRPLRTGLWLQRTDPSEDGSAMSGLAVAGTMPNAETGFQAGSITGADGVPTDRFRLAIFLPDGSAVFTRTSWLVDDHDRVARVRISDWTGLPRIDRLRREQNGGNAIGGMPTNDDAGGGQRDFDGGGTTPPGTGGTR